MTKTQAKAAEVHQEWQRLHQELNAVMREEFPPGTKVKYRHGRNWIQGTVDKGNIWDWSDELDVTNTMTGKSRRVKAQELEFDI